jgi:hypothetical protein
MFFSHSKSANSTFSRLFSASQQYFSLTTNQPTVLLAAYFQPKRTDLL